MIGTYWMRVRSKQTYSVTQVTTMICHDGTTESAVSLIGLGRMEHITVPMSMFSVEFLPSPIKGLTDRMLLNELLERATVLGSMISEQFLEEKWDDDTTHEEVFCAVMRELLSMPLDDGAAVPGGGLVN